MKTELLNDHLIEGRYATLTRDAYRARAARYQCETRQRIHRLGRVILRLATLLIQAGLRLQDVALSQQRRTLSPYS